jgi:hypothetical protein
MTTIKNDLFRFTLLLNDLFFKSLGGFIFLYWNGNTTSSVKITEQLTKGIKYNKDKEKQNDYENQCKIICQIFELSKFGLNIDTLKKYGLNDLEICKTEKPDDEPEIKLEEQSKHKKEKATYSIIKITYNDIFAVNFKEFTPKTKIYEENIIKRFYIFWIIYLSIFKYINDNVNHFLEEIYKIYSNAENFDKELRDIIIEFLISYIKKYKMDDNKLSNNDKKNEAGKHIYNELSSLITEFLKKKKIQKTDDELFKSLISTLKKDIKNLILLKKDDNINKDIKYYILMIFNDYYEKKKIFYEHNIITYEYLYVESDKPISVESEEFTLEQSLLNKIIYIDNINNIKNNIICLIKFIHNDELLCNSYLNGFDDNKKPNNIFDRKIYTQILYLFKLLYKYGKTNTNSDQKKSIRDNFSSNSFFFKLWFAPDYDFIKSAFNKYLFNEIVSYNEQFLLYQRVFNTIKRSEYNQTNYLLEYVQELTYEEKKSREKESATCLFNYFPSLAVMDDTILQKIDVEKYKNKVLFFNQPLKIIRNEELELMDKIKDIYTFSLLFDNKDALLEMLIDFLQYFLNKCNEGNISVKYQEILSELSNEKKQLNYDTLKTKLSEIQTGGSSSSSSLPIQRQTIALVIDNLPNIEDGEQIYDTFKNLLKKLNKTHKYFTNIYFLIPDKIKREKFKEKIKSTKIKNEITYEHIQIISKGLCHFKLYDVPPSNKIINLIYDKLLSLYTDHSKSKEDFINGLDNKVFFTEEFITELNKLLNEQDEAPEAPLKYKYYKYKNKYLNIKNIKN